MRIGADARFASSILLITDVVGILALANIFHIVRINETVSWSSWPIYAVVLVVIISFYIFDVYRMDLHARVAIVSRTFISLAISAMILTLIVYLVGAIAIQREPLFWRGIFPLTLVSFSVWALISRLFIEGRLRKSLAKHHFYILGEGEKAKEFYKEFTKKNYLSSELRFS